MVTAVVNFQRAGAASRQGSRRSPDPRPRDRFATGFASSHPTAARTTRRRPAPGDNARVSHTPAPGDEGGNHPSTVPALPLPAPSLAETSHDSSGNFARTRGSSASQMPNTSVPKGLQN